MDAFCWHFHLSFFHFSSLSLSLSPPLPMGNFLPSLVHCTNVPTTPSKLAKQKLHCYTVILSNLYKLRRSKLGSNHTTNPNNKEDSSRATTTKDGESKVAQEKGVIRVKVLLTKKEAAQLLAMSVKGDKTIGQIMSELKKMDVHEKSFCSSNRAWRPVLESIPEELLETP